MQSVAIFPVSDPSGTPTFRAIARAGQSEGRTAGEALDAIRAQFPQTTSCTVVVIQPFEPDAFFTAEQQQRMQALMAQWRAARDRGERLSMEKEAEIETLVAQELKASEHRTRELLQGLGK